MSTCCPHAGDLLGKLGDWRIEGSCRFDPSRGGRGFGFMLVYVVAEVPEAAVAGSLSNILTSDSAA